MGLFLRSFLVLWFVFLIFIGLNRISGQTPAAANSRVETTTASNPSPPQGNDAITSLVAKAITSVARAVWRFLSQYWMFLLTILVLYLLVQDWELRKHGPTDITGNGITIGRAKAFDNRSLTLRIERLSASLRELKTISQNVTANLSGVQRVSSSDVNRSITVNVGPGAEKSGSQSPSAPAEGDKSGTSGAPSGATAESSEAAATKEPTVALAASDMLSDQLNLASQILNLETLFERSLTDRLMGEKARLQTVLGFQVSISPPAGYENCIAVAEIAARVKDSPNDDGQPNNFSPLSLVALIPHEKTYNSQTVSTSSQSIGGSAVASVVTLGLSRKGESRQLFIHRDSDTIAFERDPRINPRLFADDPQAIVFGWEFRPVLGRSTVAAGTRQMLAVVALPIEEKQQTGEVTLEIKTRSYWRRYNSQKQTSSRRWLPVPLRVDGSNRIDSNVQELKVPNTAEIQKALAPTVSEIKWVNSGADRATVIVKGTNFFSGTKVVTGGKVHREEDNSLTLKSNQVLEFETTISSLATGDSVLSGRFGSSFQLAVPAETREVVSLSIARAVIEPVSDSKALYILIDVTGLNKDGEDQDLTIAHIQRLPEPILFVGSEPVPMPYDYYDIDPDITTPVRETIDPKASDEEMTNEVVKVGSGTVGPITHGSPAREDDPKGSAASSSGSAQSSTKKYIQVGAWIPKSLASSGTVAFRIPFCGFEYQASLPLNYSEPSVTRIGVEAQNLLLRISHPLAAKRKVSVELDRVYEEGGEELKRITDSDFRLKIPTQIATLYNYVVLIIEDPKRGELPERHLLTIPAEEKPKPKTVIDLAIKPPRVKQNALGPLEWSGAALDAIKAATLFPPAMPDASSKVTGVPCQFTVYDGGKKIEVYFNENSTKDLGKAELVFETVSGDKFHAPLFISKE